MSKLIAAKLIIGATIIALSALLSACSVARYAIDCGVDRSLGCQ